VYTCVFLRNAFSIVNPTGIGDLTLYLQSDDGYLVWLNGTNVARVNMPDGEPLVSWTSLPSAGEPNVATVVIPNAGSLLRAGVNVLAMQAFNCNLSDSTDFLISASLSGNLDIQPPMLNSTVPAKGARVQGLTGVEVVFSENVTGVDGMDLLINGAPATGLSVISPRDYAFTFAEPAAGTVYYTTDGTDPRAPGGGVSSKALIYSSSVIIQTNSRIVARARSGTRWSGPAGATFTVEVPPLALTESMYSPGPTRRTPRAY